MQLLPKTQQKQPFPSSKSPFSHFWVLLRKVRNFRAPLMPVCVHAAASRFGARLMKLIHKAATQLRSASFPKKIKKRRPDGRQMQQSARVFNADCAAVECTWGGSIFTDEKCNFVGCHWQFLGGGGGKFEWNSRHFHRASISGHLSMASEAARTHLNDSWKWNLHLKAVAGVYWLSNKIEFMSFCY